MINAWPKEREASVDKGQKSYTNAEALMRLVKRCNAPEQGEFLLHAHPNQMFHVSHEKFHALRE